MSKKISKKLIDFIEYPLTGIVVFPILALVLYLLGMFFIAGQQANIKYEVVGIEKVRELEDLHGSIRDKDAHYETKFLVTYKDRDGKFHIDVEVDSYNVKVGGEKTYYQDGVDGMMLFISEKDYKKI